MRDDTAEAYEHGGLVFITVVEMGRESRYALSADEARLLGLRLLRLADQAEDG